MSKKRYDIKKWVNTSLNILFWGCCSFILVSLLQIFCFTSFKIPSNSMEPALKEGDWILVNKMIKGARIFNVMAALRNEEVDIYRIPGYGGLKRNDVLVFNFPYQENRWDSIRMNIMQYYVKRCIALPGDTLEIRNGYYKIRGDNDVPGNRKAQQDLANLAEPEKQGIVTKTFPNNERMDWNIREFGPLPIPRQGQEVVMNETNFVIYKQLIDWEQKKKLHLKEEKVWLGDSLIHRYRFTKNYYFVSGDKMPNSQDSRYWGMLPEEYIVGKATYIWNSKDSTGKTRWKRILRKIE